MVGSAASVISNSLTSNDAGEKKSKSIDFLWPICNASEVPPAKAKLLLMMSMTDNFCKSP
jgi:hypothetical protein